MYRIFSMILIISLTGCATGTYMQAPASTPTNYDEIIADKLPLHVALEYVLTLPHMDLGPRAKCKFNLNTMSAGSSGQQPYPAFTLRSEQNGSMTVYYGDIESFKASLVVELLGRKGEENYCLLNISESSQLKAATAFKALGAMME